MRLPGLDGAYIVGECWQRRRESPGAIRSETERIVGASSVLRILRIPVLEHLLHDAGLDLPDQREDQIRYPDHQGGA